MGIRAIATKRTHVQVPDPAAVHAGQKRDLAVGVAMKPFFQTITCARSWFEPRWGYENVRIDDPSQKACDLCTAAHESGTHGIAFGSRLAASTAVIHTLPITHPAVGVYGGPWNPVMKADRPIDRWNNVISNVDVPMRREAHRALHGSSAR